MYYEHEGASLAQTLGLANKCRKINRTQTPASALLPQQPMALLKGLMGASVFLFFFVTHPTRTPPLPKAPRWVNRPQAHDDRTDGPSYHHHHHHFTSGYDQSELVDLAVDDARGLLYSLSAHSIIQVRFLAPAPSGPFLYVYIHTYLGRPYPSHANVTRLPSIHTSMHVRQPI